jgi:Flp pilus assembly protein TadD
MNQAIFLSYASQDTDAASRICQALRAAGLEVWFDKNELTGGDAWDQKIRKQIKECALFVPIISANTNAREEGYFRLEWKLSVDRSHLMADDKAFFMPVILDGVVEASARVPDKFRERQWTRLNDAESVTTFAAHVKQLLSSPPSAATMIAELAKPPQTTTAPASPAAALPSRRSTIITVAAIGTVGAMGAAGLTIWHPWQGSSVARQNGMPRDPQLRKAVELISTLDATASEVATAEELTKAVLTAKPSDEDAIVVMARVQSYSLLRGFDRSPERFAVFKLTVERALTLSPNDPEAMYAMAVYLQRSRADLPRATNLLREAIKLRPDESRYYRMLATTMANTPGVSPQEVVAYLKSAAERFPKDPLVAYDLSLRYRRAGMLVESEQHVERAIEFGPIPNAILVSAQNKLYLHGDVPGMKAQLDKLPERFRGTEKAVLTRFTYSLVSGEPNIGLEALRSITTPWMTDFEYTGPTSLLAGELLLVQGKPTFAMQRFEEASTQLIRRKTESISNALILALDTWVQMRLGKFQDAKAQNQVLFKEIARPYVPPDNSTPLFNPIFLNLLLGERTKALELMREAVKRKAARSTLTNLFRFDPRLEKFGKDTDILARLAEPTTNP